jgi:hypothetical protein
MEIYPSIEQYNIKFGLTRDAIEAILGPPTATDTIEVTKDVTIESWQYDSQQIELIFDSDDGYKLTTLSFAAKDATVNGIEVIGLEEENLLKAFPDLFCEEEKDETGYSYEHPDENLMFWILDGKVELLTVYG